jgi:hypothetical protein
MNLKIVLIIIYILVFNLLDQKILVVQLDHYTDLY